MTIRQFFLKAAYPVWMWLNKLFNSNLARLQNSSVQPPVSFYSLMAVTGYGTLFEFSMLKGKKVMIVNTASDCGYTAQYNELEKIYQQYKDKLAILAFPSNDFGHQEKGDDEAIAVFCKNTYRISFPVMSKSIVAPLAGQVPVYQWLTNPYSNGWNTKAPSWNFAKYLVDEHGVLTHYFDPSISPLSDEVIKAISVK